MNVMCDPTQFCITSLLLEKETFTLLATLFMENIILTFGIVAVVVVDVESIFLKKSKLCTKS